MERRRLVRVPASSANLGPGFDAFAAALAIHTEIEVVETGRFAVVTDLAIATDRRNLVVRGFERLHPPDRFEFRIRSDIPLSGGLGTSAAAYVGGLLAADHLFELDADVLALACELEGHPDNVAAALHGGFVICADGAPTRFDAPAGLEAILVVPHEAVRTKEARAALPAIGPDGRRGRQHRPRLAADARAGPRRLGPRRPRPRRPPPPAPPRPPLPALHGARRARDAPSAPSAPRSPAPARPSWSGATTSRPARSWRRCAARRAIGRRCCGRRSSRTGRTCASCRTTRGS